MAEGLAWNLPAADQIKAMPTQDFFLAVPEQLLEGFVPENDPQVPVYAKNRVRRVKEGFVLEHHGMLHPFPVVEDKRRTER